MHHTWVITLGIAAGVLNTLGLFPYVRDVLRGKTKPERATWWVWVALNLAALVAQVAAGGTWSVILTMASVLKNGTVAILSLKYGYGKFRRRHVVALFVAALGIVLWQLTNQPLMALVIVIAVDFAGFWLTLLKTWRSPRTETLVAWELSGLAGLCAVLAVGKLDVTPILYPLYGLLVNLLIVGIVLIRGKKS
jgi:hypothetical protein